DEGAFWTPTERQALPCRDLAPGSIVLHVDAHRARRRVEDVLRRDPDVRALGDGPRERVPFSASDAELLGPHPDLDGAGPPLQSFAPALHLGPVGQLDTVTVEGCPLTEIGDTGEAD